MKKLFAILMAALLAFTMFACTAKPSEPTLEDPAVTDATAAEPAAEPETPAEPEAEPAELIVFAATPSNFFSDGCR